MKTLEDVLREELKNPEFKKEWDALEPEFRMIRERLNSEGRQEQPIVARIYPQYNFRNVVQSF